MSAPADSAARPYQGKPIRIRADITVRQGLRTILCAGVEHLVSNQATALNGGSIECIHQMRIALRRLRATLALFREVLDTGAVAGITLQLKWLGSRLGGARDWDVFATRTLRRLPGGRRMQAVAARVAHAAYAPRRAADLRALAALGSARYRSLIRTLQSWLADTRRCEQPDPATVLLLDALLVEAGRPWLRRSARRVHHAGRHILRRTAKQRHRLRIALKQLRYDTHALAGLYPARRVKPYVAALHDLQDVLGDLNDLAVARRLLRKIDCPDRPLVDQRLAAAQLKRLKDLRAPWRAFRHTASFWK